mgnify:CR=1 FL=1|tara:strand:+ start:934 stop:1254 length:321 start_codon:yes stop_codon:yes gene_type:complete
MKTTITLNDFVNCDALKDNFSYEGLVSLFDYLENFEDDTGTAIEFDPIALRCEFSEYATIAEAYENYDGGEDLTDLEMIEWLQDKTQVIEFESSIHGDKGVILQDF